MSAIKASSSRAPRLRFGNTENRKETVPEPDFSKMAAAGPEHDRPLHAWITAPRATIAIIILGLLVLWLHQQWAPYFVFGISIFSLFLTAIVAYRLPPTVPLSKTSALFARLDWLGRFVLGGAILFGGTLLGAVSGSAVDSSDPASIGELAKFLTELAAQTLLPWGALLFALFLSVDLHRAGPEGRRRALEVDWEEMRLGADLLAVLSQLGSSLTSPPLVIALVVCASLVARALAIE